MADGSREPARECDPRTIAAALGVAKRSVERRAGKEQWPYRETTGLGGKRRLYALATLPTDVQAALMLASHAPAERPAKAERAPDTAALWLRFDNAPAAHKEIAAQRLKALDAVTHLVKAGTPLMDARTTVASTLSSVEGDARGTSVATLGRLAGMVKGLDRKDWLAALLPGFVAGGASAEIPAQAWDWYKGHYLSRSQPSHADTYDRLHRMAREQGWQIPSQWTFRRRMDAEVTRVVQVVSREGVSAANRLLPTQQRDALVFAAGEAVNGDGLKFDRLWVRFEDGEIINTATAWFWQDIHSRRILAWRLDKTENTDVFRLATYDLTGVCAPGDVWMDNTRVAANKLMTAGARGRHRFKSDPEDGVGLLLMLGMEPHFTNPDKDHGNPGAKPIERAFGTGGLHEMVATHPRIAAKGGFSKATAIDVALLREVIAEEVARFNAKPKRKTQACRGVLSYDQAWDASVQARPPRRHTEAQRRLLLMAREIVKADSNNGELRLQAGRGRFGLNAYWCEQLPDFRGRKVAAHYDPEDLAAGVHVYSLDGRYLFPAEHIARGGFNNTSAGREHSKLRRRVSKSNKEAAANESRMTAIERAHLYTAATSEPTPAPAQAESNVVAGVFQRVPDPQADAQRARATGTDDHAPASFNSYLERMQAQQLRQQGWEPRED
jgi:putative transposase